MVSNENAKFKGFDGFSGCKMGNAYKMSLIKPSWRRLPESSPHSSVGIRRQKYAGTVMGVISHDVWAYYIGCFSQLEPSGANHSPFAEFIGLDCLIHPHPRLGLRDTEEETPRRHHFTPGLFRWENRGKTSHVPSLSCEFCHFSPQQGEYSQRSQMISLSICLFFSGCFSLQRSGLASFYNSASLSFAADSHAEV